MFRKILCCVFVLICFAGDGVAQYARSGWFVVDDVNDSLVQKQEKMAEDGEKNSVKPYKRSVQQNRQKTLRKQQSHAQQEKINRNGFSLSKSELKLASLLLKKEYQISKGKNFVIAPLSFYATAVLLANGVVDSGLLEFSKLFSIFRLVDVDTTLKSYLTSKNKSLEWNISLWGNIFSQRYRTMIGDILGAETWSMQGSTDVLNSWIREKTNKVIDEIIVSRPVNDDELYVVSSLGFYQNWQYAFDEKLTKEKIFYTATGEETVVNMMYQHGTFEYFENDFMQVVRLFFSSGDYITFYLPRENADFDKFVANFEDYKMMPEMYPTDMDLFIPRFQLSYNWKNVKDVFEGFGIAEIFSSTYNFAKMINYDVSAQVSDIFLNTRLQIDEGATLEETKVDNGDNAKKQITTVAAMFNANRPFVFMLNKGDMIGVITAGNKISQEILENKNSEMVGEVVVRERKNGSPEWYEDKNQQGDFILKNKLR